MKFFEILELQTRTESRGVFHEFLLGGKYEILPECQRTVYYGLDEDEFYFSLELVEEGVLKAAADGILLVQQDKHYYAPLTWIQKTDPTFRDVDCSKFRKKIKKALFN